MASGCFFSMRGSIDRSVSRHLDPAGAAPHLKSSPPALDLKSTYGREMHLAFCASRQAIEIAFIFSTPSERTMAIDQL